MNKDTVKIPRKIAIERSIFFMVLIGGCFFAAFLKNIHTPIIGATIVTTRPDVRVICSMSVGGDGSPTVLTLIGYGSDIGYCLNSSNCPNTLVIPVTTYPRANQRRYFIFFILFVGKG